MLNDILSQLKQQQLQQIALEFCNRSERDDGMHHQCTYVVLRGILCYDQGNRQGIQELWTHHSFPTHPPVNTTITTLSSGSSSSYDTDELATIGINFLHHSYVAVNCCRSLLRLILYFFPTDLYFAQKRGGGGLRFVSDIFSFPPALNEWARLISINSNRPKIRELLLFSAPFPCEMQQITLFEYIISLWPLFHAVHNQTSHAFGLTKRVSEQHIDSQYRFLKLQNIWPRVSNRL